MFGTNDPVKQQLELYDELLTEKRDKLTELESIWVSSSPEIDLQRQTLREEILNLEIQKAHVTETAERERGAIERDLDLFED